MYIRLMLRKSKDHNPNYLCKIVQLNGLRKHSNADRLQCVDIDYQTVITGLDAKDGDTYVYFPVESQISRDFLSHTNSFREKAMNADTEHSGFFEKHCRVKAMKLRGERSMGYIVPASVVSEWAGMDISSEVGAEFDTVNEKLLVKKYVAKTRGARNAKNGKSPALSRLIEGQVHLHVDTENLRRNAHKVEEDDFITISNKVHGTSFWVSNVLVKRKLSLLERIAKFMGIPVIEQEYDLVYGSRRVVKNKHFKDPKLSDHFFGYDLWEDIKDEIGHLIPRGYTLYGEMIGYDKNGKQIQKGYPYGCDVGEHKLQVYRITYTNPDGLVFNLPTSEVVSFCHKRGIGHLEVFEADWAGEILDGYLTLHGLLHDNSVDGTALFIKYLEDKYTEKECSWNPGMPNEGIVVRVERGDEFEAYKLKSFAFLEHESKLADSNEVDIES